MMATNTKNFKNPTKQQNLKKLGRVYGRVWILARRLKPSKLVSFIPKFHKKIKNCL